MSGPDHGATRATPAPVHPPGAVVDAGGRRRAGTGRTGSTGSNLGLLIALAWKNLSRHRRRTAITAAALAFGIMLFILMDSLLSGLDQDSQRNLVWYETGTAKVLTPGQRDELQRPALKHEIVDYRAVVESLDQLGIVNTPRIVFTGELFFAEGALPVRVIAVDPERDGEVFRLREGLIAGSEYLEYGVPGMLIGQWMAADVGAQIGDYVEIRTRTRYGAVQVLELEIVGIVLSANPTINKGVGYMPLDVAQQELEMAGVTELALGPLPARIGRSGRTVAVPTQADLARVLPELNEQLATRHGGAVVAVGWDELAQDYLALSASKSSSSSIMLFVIFIIAAVGVSNTMLIAVYERIREFGMMRAMGMSDGSIRFTMMVEAGAIGLIGSLAGLVAGVVVNYFLVNNGIDFTALYGDMNIGYRVAGVFRGAWNPEVLVLGVLFGVLISMAIAYIPARRALKLDVVECLRYE